MRAVRDTERAAQRRDMLLVQAHAEGMSYGEIARATGWERKSVTRHLARVRDALIAEREYAERCGLATRELEEWASFAYTSAERADAEASKAKGADHGA